MLTSHGDTERWGTLCFPQRQPPNRENKSKAIMKAWCCRCYELEQTEEHRRGTTTLPERHRGVLSGRQQTGEARAPGRGEDAVQPHSRKSLWLRKAFGIRRGKRRIYDGPCKVGLWIKIFIETFTFEIIKHLLKHLECKAVGGILSMNIKITYCSNS